MRLNITISRLARRTHGEFSQLFWNLLLQRFSFFFVVMSAYRQIRNQNVDVLSDIDEDGFDSAFELIRPGELQSSTSLTWLLTRM